MPRMNVNLQPSVLQFNDGESPLVSSVARFGETMAKLPMQMAQLRMQQNDAQDRRNEFDAMQHLRMDQNGREALAAHQHSVETGFDIPEPGSPERGPYDYNEKMRQAELDAKLHSGDPSWHSAEPKGNDPYLYNDAGEVKSPYAPPTAHDKMMAGIPAANAEAAKRAPDYANGPGYGDRLSAGISNIGSAFSAPAEPNAFNQAHPTQAQAPAPVSTRVNPAQRGAPPPPDRERDAQMLGFALDEHAKGNPDPMTNLLRTRPDMRDAVLSIDAAQKSAPGGGAGSPFALPAMRPAGY